MRQGGVSVESCQPMEPLQLVGSGKPRFMKVHCSSVRGVAFHPKDRYLFATGGYDGKVNVCSARDGELVYSITIRSLNAAKNVNAVRFTCDGYRILVTSTSKRLTVVDVPTGTQMQTFENCTFSGRDRAALAADPGVPDTVVCTGVNGKSLTLFDLRVPVPVKLFHDLESSIIRDITFLPRDWPWCGDRRSLLYVSSSGTLRAPTLDSGATMFSIDMQHKCNSVTSPSITNYASASDRFFKRGLVAVAGDYISVFDSGTSSSEQLAVNDCSTYWKIRYTRSGGSMYSVGDDGTVQWHRVITHRSGSAKHEYGGELFHHAGDVQDMDISSYDEYLITASKDKTVGIMKIGHPNHGCTECYELT